jgi:hypothetical protein
MLSKASAAQELTVSKISVAAVKATNCSANVRCLAFVHFWIQSRFFPIGSGE